MAKQNQMIGTIKRNEIHETFSHGVIYAYSIPDRRHEGRIKIGAATATNNSPQAIEKAARKRIEQQTKTADVPYDLLLAEILEIPGDRVEDVDKPVHRILQRSGFPRKSENIQNAHSEWFEISLDIAKNAINAAREGRNSLDTTERVHDKQTEFIFRPNQRDAIEKTSKAIRKNRKHFLWNAKMRFGKTSAAMQVAKENGMQKVLIVTHRPSVKVDWYDDFNKVFVGTQYQYASKTKGEHIKTLIWDNKQFVYFASLQDLRLSKRVVEDEAAQSRSQGFDKNDEVFDTTWDMLIVDEAHEGTQSNLGDTTFSKIQANFVLQLSGTPFNLLHKHEEDDIYTWDYVMEQEAKLSWDELHPGVPNPYAELPALSIFTYDIDKFSSHIGSLGADFHDVLDGAFKFHEFFRVQKDDDGNDTAKFVHEPMVKKFLDLMIDDTLRTKFPYSTQEYRDFNKHSLWLLPNRVKVIEAMEKLLKAHPVFGSNQFGIVNISGSSRDDEEDKDAKDRVTKAIKHHDYTITLTGQRLTTGASIPEWTAVFMLSDTSSATTYLQTAFRCQTPAKIEGKLKTQGYVFDFAPDRTLRLIAEAIELNHKSGKTNTKEQREAMSKFLNFCPVLAAEGGNMKPYDVGAMLVQLKQAIIERVSRNGFDDPKLYNDELLKLEELDIAKFNELQKIVGKSTRETINEIEVNNLGMDDLQAKQAEEAERKQRVKQELTDEEKEALKKLKEAREQKRSAISILRAVSIRMPMMVYGADVPIKEDITLQKFVDLVDDESWEEFMPAGLTKEMFRGFIKYYDQDVFKGVARSIRAKVYDCDNELPTERIQAIAEIFGTFKNPDKETVLTPWEVVNMQLTTTLGGNDFRNILTQTAKPEWVSKNVPATIWSQEDVTILEINSKSGLYPLLAAYNVYSRQLLKQKKSEDKIANKLWRQVLANNIYVLCKSPMAKRITMRTLAGYGNTKMNIIYIKDLVKKLQQKDPYKGYDVTNEIFQEFGFSDKDMKFTAVVGNPPYQGENHQQIYPSFYLQARMIGEYVTLIFPVGWQGPKTANNLGKLNKLEIKRDPQIMFINNVHNVFPGIAGAEWTNIILWKKDLDNGYDGKQKVLTNGRDEKIIDLRINKDNADKPKEIKGLVNLVVNRSDFIPVQQITSVRKPYGLSTDVIKNPAKYGLPEIHMDRKGKDDIKLYGIFGKVYWLEKKYPLPRKTSAFDKFKVFVPYAWGNMSEGSGLGGAYSDIIVACPYEVVTETYQEQGPYNTLQEAKFHAKYIMTKFARALLYLNKHSQHSTTSWGAIPVQDFHEDWWDKSIQDIDEELMKKYEVPQEIKNFVFANFQTKSVVNIINYME